MIRNLKGQMFERLTVIRRHEQNSKAGKALWVCECECGNTKVVLGASLVTGKTVSCGCKQREIISKNQLKKHGHATENGMTPTYRSWADMLKRCNNPNNWAWKYYGGRGIKVCDDWADFKNFLRDMGEREKDLTLDRIDNEGNYEKDNCRWATRKQQSQNRRKPFAKAL